MDGTSRYWRKGSWMRCWDLRRTVMTTTGTGPQTNTRTGWTEGKLELVILTMNFLTGTPPLDGSWTHTTTRCCPTTKTKLNLLRHPLS